MTKEKQIISPVQTIITQAGIFAYLIAWLLFSSWVLYSMQYGVEKNTTLINMTSISCITLGVLGGVFYCLRGLYINISVHNQWGNQWIIWYLARPITSAFAGGISYVFLKAGLLVLDTAEAPIDNPWGYYTFAIIAGMNVDNFMKKIEEIGKTVMGISPSKQNE